MIGNIYECTDCRRWDDRYQNQRIKVITITGNGYALCAPRINGKYRDNPKAVRRIRSDRLNPRSHWKLVKAA